jgi:hypothetical protein
MLFLFLDLPALPKNSWRIDLQANEIKVQEDFADVE